MKREHKYRGRRLDGQGWIFGDLIENQGRYFIYHETSESTLQDNDASIVALAISVDNETVGQFTGLKDKNGRDIYEGDIIECVDSHGEPVRHFVEFCERRGYYAQYFAGHSPLPAYEAGPIYQDYIDKFGKYVIGNIHDNPELLKTE